MSPDTTLREAYAERPGVELRPLATKDTAALGGANERLVGQCVAARPETCFGWVDIEQAGVMPNVLVWRCQQRAPAGQQAQARPEPPDGDRPPRCEASRSWLAGRAAPIGTRPGDQGVATGSALQVAGRSPERFVDRQPEALARSSPLSVSPPARFPAHRQASRAPGCEAGRGARRPGRQA